MSNNNVKLSRGAGSFIILGALFCGSAVVLGAFGAHALKSVFTMSQLSTFEVGVRYQMYHGLALLVLPSLTTYLPRTWLQRAGICFVVGCLLFSGSLYALVATGITWFGPITPIGGGFFIIGWIMLISGALLRNRMEK
ncbi:DUF423 domain-containing protein [Alteromonas sp. A079]|uniref:DUF423 domain-containing protein n=1 Tax=Alteromonas sp. A079 TaxID=3410268 RepID=UPI003B9DFF7E